MSFQFGVLKLPYAGDTQKLQTYPSPYRRYIDSKEDQNCSRFCGCHSDVHRGDCVCVGRQSGVWKYEANCYVFFMSLSNIYTNNILLNAKKLCINIYIL